MTDTETKHVSITKLKNGNYQMWKFKVEMLLSGKELWDVVSEVKPEPTPADWEKRDRKAKANIGLLVEDDQLVHIRDQESARGMWLELQKVHERKNMNNKLFLLRKLYKMKLTEDRCMPEHISGMLETVAQLRGIGKLIDNSDVAAMLLCSLPDSYGTLVTALEARPEDELTLEYVKGKLMDEYQRRNESHQSQEKGAEAALKTKTGEYKFSKGQNETRTCYWCKKSGHLKKDCYKWKAAQRLKHQNPQSAKTVAVKENQGKTSAASESNDDHLCFSIGIKEQLQEVQCDMAETQKTSNGWCIDSGASTHMTNDRSFYTHLDTSRREKIYLADGKCVIASGIGQGYIECAVHGGTTQRIIVKDVLYVPQLEGNLLSVRRLTMLGYKVEFKGNTCNIKNGELTVATGKVDVHLYKLTGINRAKLACQGHKNCIHMWHRRLGHRDPAAINRLINCDMAEGVDMSTCNVKVRCECCVKGKMTKKPFPKCATGLSSEPMQLVHSDVCGPMKTSTVGGKRYFLTCIDDYTRYTVTYLLNTKDEVETKLIEYVAMVENKFHRKPQILRSDGGGEFTSKRIDEFLRRNGIQRQLTVPYSPEQNGVAERKNRSLVEMTRCMLIDAGLPHMYWGEALMTATYLQNRLPSRSTSKTPYELWNGKVPTLSHTRVFGCKAFMYTPKERRTKLDDRAEEGILVGYCDKSKGYRILNPRNKKITISRSVWFDEGQGTGDNVLVDLEGDETAAAEPRQPESSSDKAELQLPSVEDDSTKRRSERSNKGVPPDRLSYRATVAVDATKEPATWNEMLGTVGKEKMEWKKAADDEIKALKDNKAWDLVSLPEGKRPIGCRWVFKKKLDAQGQISKYKARLVAKGYSQKQGEDFEETYAPVAKQTTIRTLLTIAAVKKLRVRHMDVKSAFLNGELDETIYMLQPEGYVEENQTDLVCKLNKSLYGLKQAARTWNNKVNHALTSQGYTRSKADPCLYTRQEKGKWTYILIHVDDLLICDSTEEGQERVIRELDTFFELHDLGEATCYLGIQIDRGLNGSFQIHQRFKIEELIGDLGLNDAKGAKTPMDVNYIKFIGEEDVLPNNEKYRQTIGKLLFIATTSRPDIAAPIGILCRRVANPRERDWIAVKRVVRYLKSTINAKLLLGCYDVKDERRESVLTGFADADWGGDMSDRKSTSGYIFLLGQSTISWSSRKQTIVALSSTEAELVAAAYACQEATWIRQLLSDFGLPQFGPTTLFEDNQGCISLTKSEKVQQRSKHIDIKYFHLRDLQERGVINLEYCPTEEMLADALTKPLVESKFTQLVKHMNVSVS